MKLATHVIPVSWLRISGAIYLLLTYAVKVLTGTILLLTFSPRINGGAELRLLRHEPGCGNRRERL